MHLTKILNTDWLILYNTQRCIALFFFLILVTSTVNAQPQPLCPTQTNAIQHHAPTSFPIGERDHTKISADFIRANQLDKITLQGNVDIHQHLLHVTAQQATHYKQRDIVEFSGDVHVDTLDLSIDADVGKINLDNKNQAGDFKQVRFSLTKSDMKGLANALHADSNNQIILQQASFTTCPLQNPDWSLNAKEIRIDNNDEYGSADHVVMRFKDVPFFYLPYIEFPTSDKRRSGILFPNIGFSNTSDFEFSLPWYWNIAPNQDALITPHYMKRRGTAIDANYRFLTPSTTGILEGSYLDNDKITHSTRHHLRYRQKTNLLSNLTFTTELNDVSDAAYFNDFNNSINLSSTTHLNRHATLNYHISNWNIRALVENMKTVDDQAPIVNRPYKRLPQLTLKGNTKLSNSPLFFTFSSEFVDFKHDSNNKTTGRRLILQPGLQMPLSGAAWFFTPAIKLNHRQYSLEENNLNNVNANIENHNTTISSLDTGLFFEKSLAKNYIQTLEPRLFYLYIPYKNQQANPLFDTSIPEFSITQLFRDNRFIGGDRLGDANQLTLSLSTKIFNQNSGKQVMRASIGQIFYFKDREVSLNNTVDTSSQSDIISELDISYKRWRSKVDLQWNDKDKELSKQNYALHYKSDANHLFNLGYRKQLKNNTVDIEQTDSSFVYAFNTNYTGYLRWNYSLKTNRDIDTIAGISYNSCCWSLQLLLERRLQNTSSISDPYRNSILIQFVFKGLGSLSGARTQQTLQKAIFGYNDTLH